MKQYIRKYRCMFCRTESVVTFHSSYNKASSHTNIECPVCSRIDGQTRVIYMVPVIPADESVPSAKVAQQCSSCKEPSAPVTYTPYDEDNVRHHYPNAVAYGFVGCTECGWQADVISPTPLRLIQETPPKAPPPPIKERIRKLESEMKAHKSFIKDHEERLRWKLN